MTVAPVLVLAVGNPSRGDDALGPMLLERLAEAMRPELARGELELLTEFQLQPENALDLEGRRRVIFVDASARAPAPFVFERVQPGRDDTVSTHAFSPAAVMAALRDALHQPMPEAWTLAVRGQRFELGAPLSAAAEDHLDAALDFLLRALRGGVEVRRRLEVQGIVQGVGFRPWVHRTATRLGLRGAVWNTPQGVTIEVAGSAAALDALVRAIHHDAPPAAVVRGLRCADGSDTARADFVIAESEGEGGQGAALVPPDLAACDACLRDTDDPRDRRYDYAFTSCAHCGPRYSITRALPFDRARTSMASMPPCPRCAQEYGTPADRRFHAETLACARCGPKLWLASVEGLPLEAAPGTVAQAAAMLRAGRLLMVQGVGAFHLVCDATSAAAVRALRGRKRRDAQPFAVMAHDLPAAESLVHLDDALREALSSAARPIVLATTRADAPLATAAVNGPSARTGVMLPYTPMLHRLTRAAGVPLVVTSANHRGAPAIIDHAEALRVAPELADALVLHDRAIVRRVEDSVVAAAHRGVRVLRRARGFAPRPVTLPAPSPQPVLAMGGHLKNAACLVVGDLAYLTPHLGDLDSFEGERSWAREVESLEQLLGVRAEVLAHDLHPDYASTRYALQRRAARRVGVQHHVAHAMAALAEHRVTEPVIAVAFDGTGYGTDGTAWGGEVLILDGVRWERLSALRALPLPGGERAVREPWRVALGALADAVGPDEARALAATLAPFDQVPREDREVVLRMIAAGVSVPRARGVGRYFDAAGALILGLARADFDAHVAVALEELAIPSADAYPYAAPSSLDPGGRLDGAREIDLRPTLRAVLRDLHDGVARGLIAGRFHATVVEATAGVVARALAETGLRRVVLCGGAMQNRLLEQGLVARLGESRVVVPREVPVNDGGLSLGQAWFAALTLREGA